MGATGSGNKAGTSDLESKKGRKVRGWAQAAARVTAPLFIDLFKLGLIFLTLLPFAIIIFVLAVR